MRTPIILSLYLNSCQTSMACFFAKHSALKKGTFSSCLSLCIPNGASQFDEETEYHVGSMSDFIICMIRVYKSSQNDWFSSWYWSIVRYSLLDIPIELCSICLVENSHVNISMGWIQCQS